MGKQNEKMAPAENVAAVETVTVQYAEVKLPWTETLLNDGYPDSPDCNRCDMGYLTVEHGRKLRALRRGFVVKGYRLKNGGEIKSLADVVRMWLDGMEI